MSGAAWSRPRPLEPQSSSLVWCHSQMQLLCVVLPRDDVGAADGCDDSGALIGCTNRSADDSGACGASSSGQPTGPAVSMTLRIASLPVPVGRKLPRARVYARLSPAAPTPAPPTFHLISSQHASPIAVWYIQAPLKGAPFFIFYEKRKKKKKEQKRGVSLS